MKNLTQINVIMFLVLFMVIMNIPLIFADNILAGDKIPNKSNSESNINPLLSELQLAGRFNMGYPLKNIGYGSEYSFNKESWINFITTYGTGWRLMWDTRTGRPNLIEGKGIPFYAGKGNTLEQDFEELTIEYLHKKTAAFIESNMALLKLDLAKLKINQEGSHIFENGRYCVIQYDYYMNDVVVEGARVFFRFNNGNIIQFGSIGISDSIISSMPVITAHQANDNVMLAFSDNENQVKEIVKTELKVVPEIPEGQKTHDEYVGKEGEGIYYRLIWSVVFIKSYDNKGYEAWVDASTGKIVQYEDLTLYGHTYGNVTIIPGNRVDKVLPYCTVQNNGAKNTNFWGYYNYTNNPSADAISTLNGQYITIADTCGAISLTTAAAPGDLNFGSSLGTDCTTPGTGGAGNTYAARSSFWHATLIRTLADYYLPANVWLDSNLTINTNDNTGACNAWWSSTAGEITVLQSDADCNNTGEVGGTIYHEWGHGLDYNDGGPAKTPSTERATGEAYGDSMDALLLKDPCHSQGMRKFNSCYNCPAACHGSRYIALRFDDDNDPGTPDVPVTPQNLLNDNGADCDRFILDPDVCSVCPYSTEDPTCATPSTYRGIMGYQGHCESHIASGAVWDMVQNIVAARGEEGWIWSARIWLETRPSAGSAYQITAGGECNTNASIDGCAASNWYTVLLGADDDDGNLANGTPNGGRIWNGFNNHGIACGASPANYNVCTEPSTPTLYAAPSNGQISLSWTPSTNATGYRIYASPYATAGNCTAGSWIPVTQTGNANVLWFNVRNDIGWGWAVKALNGSDECVSGLSNCVFAEPTSAASTNLTAWKITGWEYVFVPSNNVCDLITCTRSATLSADPLSSNINFRALNNSTVNAGVHKHRVYADDTSIFVDNRASLAANTSYVNLNSAITLKGGRHMLKLQLDADNELAESNEMDNEWIASVAIYDPYNLDPVMMTIRSAPPDRNPEGYSYYSCDGYRFSVTPSGGQGYWGAVAVLPSLSTANFDIRLHDDYTGSTQGFGANLKWSTSGTAGQIEIIGVNRNMTTTATWWAGAIQGENALSSSSYQIHKDVSQGYIGVPSSGATGNIPMIGVVSVEEIYVDSGDVGMTYRITVTPDGGDIGIALINEAAEYFRLSDAYPGTLVNNAGNDAAEFFDIEFLTTGFYGLLIYKPDYTQQTNSIDYVIDISIAPSNLRPYLHTGWTAQAVPRDSGGCTINGCLVSATLPGWAGTTYVNSTSINDGPLDVNTPFQLRYMLDDVTLEEGTYASLPVGFTALDTNNALASTVKGGRHTLGMFIDANNNYAESNESDNTFYRQYVWSPYLLENEIPYSTTAPPDRNSTGYVSFNCDGYEFVVQPDDGVFYWGVVGILPVDSTADYMLRLFDDYTGSTVGFSTSVVTSNNSGAGGIEAVGVNRNATGIATWWAGAIQGNNTPSNSNYWIYESLSGAPIEIPSSGNTGNVPVNGSVAIEEIEVDAVDLGMSWTVTVTPTGGDIGIALIDGQVWANFSLADAMPGTNVNSNGVNQPESFAITFSATGYYGLIIYKPDSSQRANSIDYTIDISLTPSNLRPYTRAGWTAPAVPRSSGDCTQNDCLVSATLSGWFGNTYLNSTNLNEGPNNVSSQFSVRYTVDDVTFKETPFPGLVSGGTAFDLNLSSGVVKGGRHTLGLIVDAYNQYAESNESDNTSYNQFIWSPMMLVNNGPVSSSAPPDRDSTGYVIFNCDGYEFSVIPGGGQNYWGTVGMLPFTASANYDLRLHDDYTGSTGGFANTVVASDTNPAGAVEIIGVNRHNAGSATWWGGTIQGAAAPDGSAYAMHKNVSGAAVEVPSSGTSGNIIANGVVVVEEINVEAADLGISWTFTVTPADGDIGIALISQSAQYFRLSDAIPGTLVNTGGVNQAETFDITFAIAGYYALLIYKPDSTQLSNSISYVLNITAGGTGGVAETPDGNIIPGVPLTMSKSGTTQLQLNWGASCDETPGTTHYSIYYGSIAILASGTYSHVPQLCASGTDTSEIINDDPTDNFYYLIVSFETTEEGGYGFDSAGIPRPASTNACLVQNRIDCP